MPANRVTALSATAIAIIGALVPLLGAISDPIAQAVVVSVALIVVGAVAIVFLLGWQKHETRTENARRRPPGPLD